MVIAGRGEIALPTLLREAPKPNSFGRRVIMHRAIGTPHPYMVVKGGGGGHNPRTFYGCEFHFRGYILK